MWQEIFGEENLLEYISKSHFSSGPEFLVCDLQKHFLGFFFFLALLETRRLDGVGVDLISFTPCSDTVASLWGQVFVMENGLCPFQKGCVPPAPYPQI